MVKLCNKDCYAICDFCIYFRDHVLGSHSGWCDFHEAARDLTDECDEFHCMTLPLNGEAVDDE